MIVRDRASSDVVVVGAGMVAHRFVESILRGDGDAPTITVIGEEGHAPYDRVGLTSYFTGATAGDLALDARVTARCYASVMRSFAPRYAFCDLRETCGA